MKNKIKVILVRSKREGRSYAQALAAIGVKAYVTPAITIRSFPVTNVPDLPRPTHFDGVIFPSKNAVSYFLRRAQKHYRKKEMEQLRRKPMAAVGEQTAKTVTRFTGTKITFPKQGSGAKALVQELRGSWSAKKAKRLLIPCARGESTSLASRLQRLGYQVTLLPCYQSIPRIPNQIDLAPLRGRCRTLAVAFFSSKGAQAYTRAVASSRYKTLRNKSIALAAGNETYNTISRLGYNRKYLVASLNPQGVVDSLRRAMIQWRR